MPGFEIIGTGHYVPGNPIKNSDLERVMAIDWHRHQLAIGGVVEELVSGKDARNYM